jgi:hypothetical protein
MRGLWLQAQQIRALYKFGSPIFCLGAGAPAKTLASSVSARSRFQYQ